MSEIFVRTIKRKTTVSRLAVRRAIAAVYAEKALKAGAQADASPVTVKTARRRTSVKRKNPVAQ
jgi:hypothetical protein